MTTLFNVSKDKISSVWSNFKFNIAPLFNGSTKEPNGFLTASLSGNEIIKLLGEDNNFPKDDVASIIKFIELCNGDGKLNNWTVAIKTTGSAKIADGSKKKILYSSQSNLNEDIELSIRRGPSKIESQESYRNSFLNRHLFHMTGKNANILSSSKDLSVRLSSSTINAAESSYIEDKISDIRKRKSHLSEEEARKEIKTIPERVYRERMGDDEAVLIIYLFDSYYSFNQDKSDGDFNEYVKNNDIDLSIPLIGYAIGFPPIEDDPGGVYVQGDYAIEDEYEDEAFSEEDSELPKDYIE